MVYLVCLWLLGGVHRGFVPAHSLLDRVLGSLHYFCAFLQFMGGLGPMYLILLLILSSPTQAVVVLLLARNKKASYDLICSSGLLESSRTALLFLLGAIAPNPWSC
eukprot:c43285_g1_i1 orf=547-864(+)